MKSEIEIGLLLNIHNPEVLLLAGFLKMAASTRGRDLLAVGVAELGFQELIENPLQAQLTPA